MISGHGVARGPLEIVVKCGSKAIIIRKAHILKSQVETVDGTVVHLLMRSVAAVHADDGRFVSVQLRE